MREAIPEGGILNPDTLSRKCGILAEKIQDERSRPVIRLDGESLLDFSECGSVQNRDGVLAARDGCEIQSEQSAEQVADG